MENESMANHEILEELLKESKKRTAYNKIAAMSLTGLLVAFIVVFFVLVPKAYNVLLNANRELETAEVATEEIRIAASSLTEMIENITVTSESVNDFIVKNSEAMASTVEKMESIDYETLNKAINDLQDAVEPFAKFMNRFK